MIDVDGILVEKEILQEYFLCDIEKCKGECCTFPGVYGAPLSYKEVPILEDHVEIVRHNLSQKSLNYIAENGVVENHSGRYTTVCINSRDCVFVYYNRDIALCAIEREYLADNTKFRKPISCWLFPIRVAYHKDIMYLYYEKISECKDAVKNGKLKNQKIYQTLKEPLIALLGKDWYDKLEQATAHL